MSEKVTKIALIEDDLWLSPYFDDIKARIDRFYEDTF